jgi:hypothetical protein
VFNLPDYPNVYTTRQISCVSCKEKFAVTEGGNGAWRVQPNVPGTVNLYYEPRRQQRPVVPIPRQVQQPEEDRIGTRQPFEFDPHAVNCPRCGADNRNWLALKVAGNAPVWQVWQQRFPKSRWAILISLLIAAIALLLPSLFEVSWPKAIFLALATPIFTLLLIVELSDKWDKLREDKHRAKILPKTGRFERSLWIKSFGWLLIAALLVPVIIFSGFPAAFQALVEFIDGPPEALVETTAAGIEADFNTQVNEAVGNLNAFGQDMGETIASFPDGDLPELERQKERLSDALANTAVLAAEEVAIAGQQTMTQIDKQLENELAALETARTSERKRFVQEIMADVRYLAVWGALVGLSLFITIMLVLPEVKKFALRVDANLPPPVYYSVANMTRLVAWEARQALEVGNHHFDIQWMSVNRNDKGGLDLVGLFRDPPQFDMFGQATGDLVRAQKHTIHTDEWCRVTEASIEDVLVPVPAGAPAGVMQLPVPLQHDAPANVRIRLPER